MRFSDLPLFLINNTKYEFVAVSQNSCRSQKVVDEKESSIRSSCIYPDIYKNLEYNIQVLTIETIGRKPSCIRVQMTAVTSTFYFMLVLCVLYSKTLKR